MDPKNMNLYVGNKSYFIIDQYQKDTCLYAEDAYYHFDIDVDRMLLHKKINNEYLDIDIQIKLNLCHYN